MSHINLALERPLESQ